MTIPNHHSHEGDVLTWQDLHAAEFNFNSPFQIQLAGGDIFYADQVVRIIPRRRIVAFGTWQGKSVVAKLFFHAKHAKQQMEKDITGIKRLRDSKIPTPPLLYKGFTKDKRIFISLSKRVFDSENLETIWLNKNSVEEMMPLLEKIIIELATQHVLGVMHRDLHLKNFLLTKKLIYTLDGAEVDLFPYLLPKKLSMKSLALFISQLGVVGEAYQEKLFRHYAKARGWILKNEDIVEMFLLIKKWNEERWQRYERKIFRQCTNFASIQDFFTFGMFDRNYSDTEFLTFLKNPEAIFNHPTVKVLKAGRSATVIKVTLDQRELVIKRYNMKNVWHRLRRSLRPTRAATSWRLAQKLVAFCVPTAKPVAFIEKRCLGFRGKSYYVTEYIEGSHAGEFFNQHQMQDEKTSNMVNRITELLKNIAKLEITHGDLKITNILIDTHEHPLLIDLDGAAEHASISGLRAAWRKEIKRFMENFHHQPDVLTKFQMELGKK